MSLDYAVLGFLNYKPMSGYDLKKIFDDSVRHFWHADQSQIYRTLSRLTEQEMVEVEVVRQEDRPDRKVYHITEQGKQSLLDWIAGPIPNQMPHSAPLIQVFFSGSLSNEEILEKFESVKQMFEMILAQYHKVPAVVGQYEDMVGSERETFFWMLTLELGIKTMQVQLEWAQSVIDRIKNNEVPAL